ncbi:MAG: repair protein SbcC/Rad50, partial [Acidimicrobiaceae bacterium]
DACVAESRLAIASLHSTRDGVSSLDPPSIDDADIAASWQTLSRWASERSQSLILQITTLADSAAEAQGAARHATTGLSEAESTERRVHEQFTAASIEMQRAHSERDTAQKRASELANLLSGAPVEEAIVAELERVKTLEKSLTDIAAELITARASTAVAREAVTSAEAAIATSWQQLRRMRDPLAQFDAPELGGANLAADWDLTIVWARAEAEARAARIQAQEHVIAEAEAQVSAAAAALTKELVRHEIALEAGLTSTALAERAPSAVASVVATADAALMHAKQRRAQSEKMRAEMKTAEESASVAHMLSNLMKAGGFPRWLISSALDALLRDASAILLELSGGQFELARDERELLVIDHNDADMSRIVKTLSGGETFQASLALALALSEQVTALSAAGASRLESIFLDEGFGTLDENTLDVVAGSLENLASSGTRMVGVITHVAALAERIPVRYEVNRDSAGSHIERIQA